ncbi:Transposase zinc-ribbon domain-containing protein, partial [Dysosmobacter welbionis]
AFHHRRPADRPGRTGGGGAGLSDSPRRDAHRRHGGLRQRPPDRHGGCHRRYRLYRPRHGAGGPMRAEVLPGFLGGVQEPGR